MHTQRNLFCTVICALVVLSASYAQAAPFNLTATLTGDGRPGNPDNLNVLVTITGDTNSNQATFVVDLNMAASHPNAKLHEFYFTMAGDAADYSFGNFLPVNWEVTDIDVNNAQGSGNTDFMVEISDNTHNVTNAVNLSFTLFKNTGLFAVADFLAAIPGCSNDINLGCGQLGAHIGSLVAGQGESNSGFALGGYLNDIPDVHAPEPASMLLTGTGLLALARSMRRKKA